LLKFIPGIGNKFINNLIKEQSEFLSSIISLNDLKGIIKEKMELFDRADIETIHRNISRVEESLCKNSINLTNITDTNYPISLKRIYDPPALLFYKGDIEYDFHRSISIVGTRKYSKYGELVCKSFVEVLSEHKFTIISGLAAGIDSIAHRKSLEKNAKCIGIIGNGLEHIYPPANKSLYKSIIDAGGGIISEFVPWQEPYPAFFPMRNRIIAGISRATLVIEAASKSGSLITAKCAFDENREVYAIPGDINYKERAGCNDIIKKQIAKLITEPLDIIKDLGIQKDNKPKSLDNQLSITPEFKDIFDILSLHPYSSEELSYKTQKTISELNSALSEMELEGIITRNDQNKWLRV
jgi:DNA processing protein